MSRCLKAHETLRPHSSRWSFQLVFNFEQTRTVTIFGEHGIWLIYHDGLANQSSRITLSNLSVLWTGPKGDCCSSIFQFSSIELKKVLLWIRTSKTFVYWKCMDFISSSAFLRLCCKFSKKTIFYLPVNTDKPSRFLGARLLQLLHLSLKCRLPKL